jgi:hypothetical protein
MATIRFPELPGTQLMADGLPAPNNMAITMTHRQPAITLKAQGTLEANCSID